MRASILLALLLLGCQNTSLTSGGKNDLSMSDLATNDLSTSDLAGTDLGGSCAGLDETTCLARTGCIADYCNECSCANTYVGCRAPSAAHTMCPALGCAQPECCTTDAQCGSGSTCFAPGSHGGAQLVCQDSTACAADGEVCVQGSCEPPSCGTAAQPTACPANFVCTPSGSTASCVRKACTTSTDCGGSNACVDGACFHDQGSCGQPVP